MVGKCLANLDLNKTICAYTIILLFKRLKELCKIKRSTTLSHVFILVKMFEFTVSAMVRGYHVYQGVWEVCIGEILPCIREVGNRHDPYAIAVKKDGSTSCSIDSLAARIAFEGTVLLKSPSGSGNFISTLRS